MKSEQKIRYEKYLLSDEWRELKLDLLMKRGCKCEKCKRSRQPNMLQVHHKTYDRIFNEKESDLILLCGKCHMREHGLLNIKKEKQKKTKKINFSGPSTLQQVQNRFLKGKYKSWKAYQKDLTSVRKRGKLKLD